MGKQTNVSSSASSGIGFTGLLTIAFIVLKLLNVIDWGWWWVLSPLWVSTGLGILVLLGIFIWAIIAVKRDERNGR